MPSPRYREVLQRDDRMYVSSLDPGRLTAEQWLLLVRSHWGVENQCHHTLDTDFAGSYSRRAIHRRDLRRAAGATGAGRRRLPLAPTSS
jgi:hypothetical protein